MIPQSNARIILQVAGSVTSLAFAALLPFNSVQAVQVDGSVLYRSGKAELKIALALVSAGLAGWAFADSLALENAEIDRLNAQDHALFLQQQHEAAQAQEREATQQIIMQAKLKAHQAAASEVEVEEYSRLTGVPADFIRHEQEQERVAASQQQDKRLEIERLQAAAAAAEAQVKALEAQAKADKKANKSAEPATTTVVAEPVGEGLNGDRPPLTASEVEQSTTAATIEPQDQPQTLPQAVPQNAPQTLPIYLAKSVQTGEAVHWNLPLNGGTSGVLAAVGVQGAGKTQATLRFLDSFQKANISVVQFDFHGDIKPAGFERFSFDFGPDSCGVNPLEIVDKSPASGGPMKQKLTVQRMLSSYIGTRQSSALGRAIDRVYTTYGIVQNKPDTWQKPAPKLGHVMVALELEMSEAAEDKNASKVNSLEGLIDSLSFICQAPIFDKPPVDMAELCNGYHVVDVSNLTLDQDNSLQQDVANLLLSNMCRYLRSQGEIPTRITNPSDCYRLMVGIDEGSIMFERANKMIEYIVIQMRKFGLGVFIFTQDTSHYDDAVLRLIPARLLMRLGDDFKQLESIAKDLNLGKDGVEILRKSRGAGHCNFKDSFSTTLQEVQFELVG